jgi:lysophospholipase L1-like esterase
MEYPLPDWRSYILFAIGPVITTGLYLLALRQRQRWCGRSPAWVCLVALNLLAALCLVAWLFLALESHYRFFFDESSGLNATLVSRRWFARHYHLNAVGVRDNLEYQPSVPAGKRRITFIGDSFTAGQGINNVDQRFANRLRLRHSDWDVQVLAVPGLDTGDELRALQGMLSQRYPMDILVLVYCINDIGDIIPEWQNVLSQLETQANPGWLVRHSYYADYLWHRWQVRHQAAGLDFISLAAKAHHGAPWDAQKQRLAEFKRLVDSGGGQLVVMTFPFVHNLGPDYPLAFAHDQLSQFWKEQNVRHLDLLPVLTGRSVNLVVNRDDNHPNETAHALAAEALDPLLAEALLRRP